MLQALVVGLGALLVVGSAAIKGYLIHRAVLRHAPALGRVVPRDGGVYAGLVVGITVVALWVVSSG